MGFPGGSEGKESACNAGDLGSIPGLGRSPGGGHGNTPQYSCLENPHGQRSLAGYSPWGCRVRHHWETKHSQCRRFGRHGFDPWVGKIPWRRASVFFSILAWRIPRTEEPTRLQSLGSQSQAWLKWLSTQVQRIWYRNCSRKDPSWTPDLYWWLPQNI